MSDTGGKIAAHICNCEDSKWTSILTESDFLLLNKMLAFSCIDCLLQRPRVDVAQPDKWLLSEAARSFHHV